MKDFNDNFEATIGSQDNQISTQIEQKNDNAKKNVKEETNQMQIDNGNKDINEKEKEDILLARKRNREEEEKQTKLN